MTYSDLGSLLRTLRDAAGLTQAELGRRLTLSRVAVTQYESATRRVPLDVAERWARECGHALIVRSVPLGDRDPDPTPEELAFLARVRALRAAGEVESVELLLDLARALPGHPAAREVVRAGVAVLGRSGLTAGAPA